MDRDAESVLENPEEILNPSRAAAGSVRVRGLAREGYEAVPIENQGHNLKHCICPRCNKLLREPVQLGCGDRMCLFCSESLAKSKDKICPRCSEKIDPEKTFSDAFALKETMGLEVECPSKCNADSSERCYWRGTLREFLMHSEECEYVSIPCSECGEMVPRKALLRHKMDSCDYRMTKCRHCNADMLQKNLKTHHDNECQEIMVACPNACSSTLHSRKSLESHSKICPMQVVNCYYHSSGCEYKGPRRDLRSHHDSSVQYHMQLIDKNYHDIKDRPTAGAHGASVHLLEKKVQDLTRTVDEQSSLIRQMNNRHSMVERERDELMRTLRDLRADVVRATARISTLEERAARPFPATTSSEGSSLSPSLDAARLDAVANKLDRLDSTVSGHVVTLADMNMRQDILEVRQTNGEMVWKISDLQRRMREASTGKTPSLYSPPFYTSQCGYKMCLRIYLHGDGGGHKSHMSLFFALMRGDFDSLLRWPFQQKVTLTLLDQTPVGSDVLRTNKTEVFRPDVTSSSFHRPDSDMNVATGCPRFVPLNLLRENSPYTRGDSIFIKVSIDVNGIVAPDVRRG